MKNIRNVAIIAHVDHGKTTLVDALLRQSQTKLTKELAGSDTLIMDSNDLERERGITIFSKNASIEWQGQKINIIDTPGHADFGGEVERVLSMADGCLLLVDAQEGPMPQTRFVLKEALKLGQKIIVVINKIDKPDARIDYAIDKTFDLFLELGAEEETAFFPIVYCSSKLGLAGETRNLAEMRSIDPIFEAILKYIPPPAGDPDRPLQILITATQGDSFKGRIGIGRVFNGKLSSRDDVVHINRDGTHRRVRLTELFTYQGLDRVPSSEAKAGDIVALAGISDITIGETIADISNPQALPLLSIEEPTVRMTFQVNASPFAGREGEFKTPRQIQDRLHRELETDVALKVQDDKTGWVVSGRGELHLAILIERMRREGFEFEVSRPQAIDKEISGQLQTPYERVFIEVPEGYSGPVIQKMGKRHGELQDMGTEKGITYLEYIISTKDLFGFKSEFIADTHGQGIFNSTFLEYRPDHGTRYEREQGSLVAHEAGVTKLHGLVAAQARGTLFMGPGVPVYEGQVVGRNARQEDIRINVCREKQLTNNRSKGEGVSEHFNAPEVMTLEKALEYIDEHELVEVTPQNIRIRKTITVK